MSASKTFKFEDGPAEATKDSLQVVIPEVLDPSYGMYVWPCAAVLAQYIWYHRDEVRGKHVLEIGAGTSLPGVTAAKLGASLTLSDDVCQPLCKENALKSCQANGIQNLTVTGISWGYITSDMINIPPVDILLASDCFYNSKVSIVASNIFYASGTSPASMCLWPPSEPIHQTSVGQGSLVTTPSRCSSSLRRMMNQWTDWEEKMEKTDPGVQSQ